MQRLVLLLPILFFFACQQNTDQAVDMNDPAALQAAIKSKKADIKTMEADLTTLEKQLDKIQPRAQNKRVVSTQPAERQDFETYVKLQGAIEAEDLISVTSEVPGRIIQLNVKEGQAVRKGELVAKLDLEASSKQIAELETSLELAADVFERQKRLWDQKIGSEVQFLQAKNSKERLEKSLETARFQLTKANIYAPISGVVETVMTKSGELASPGMPIAQILDTRKIKAVVEVPETYLTALKKGQKVKVFFPALDREVIAPVTLVGKTINPANRTFKVEIDVKNTDGMVKPNLLANVEFRDKYKKDVVTVPLEILLQEAGGRDYVYAVQKNKTGEYHVKKHYVTVGESYDGQIVINEGLEGGEALIVEGVRSVAENELVQIKASSKTATNG